MCVLYSVSFPSRKPGSVIVSDSVNHLLTLHFSRGLRLALTVLTHQFQRETSSSKEKLFPTVETAAEKNKTHLNNHTPVNNEILLKHSFVYSEARGIIYSACLLETTSLFGLFVFAVIFQGRR